MRLIFDTNLPVSALIKPVSRPAMALQKAEHWGKLYFSEEIFVEIREVLMRNKFDRYIPRDERLNKLNTLLTNATLVSPNIDAISACRDPKDNKFLELAVYVQATYIITGDKDLLELHPFRDIPIITATEFLSMLF